MMADLGWTKHQEDMERAHQEACYWASAKAGYTCAEADKCVEGSLGCPDCPWKLAEGKE